MQPRKVTFEQLYDWQTKKVSITQKVIDKHAACICRQTAKLGVLLSSRLASQNPCLSLLRQMEQNREG